MIPFSSVTALRQLPVNVAQTYIPIDQPLVTRHKRNTATSPEPAADNPRVKGDSELAKIYAKVLLQANGAPSHDREIMVENIPSDSTFGQWWAQLGSAFESQEVREWLTSMKADRQTLKLNAHSGTVSFRTLDGANIVMPREANNTWMRLSGPIMKAAQIVSYYSSAPYTPPLSKNVTQAPLGLVARFYREQPVHSIGQAQQRAAELERDKAFPELSMEHFSFVHKQRSEEALDEQKALVANTQTLQDVASTLRYLASALEKDGTTYYGGALDYLKHKDNYVTLRPDSTFPRDKADKWGQVNLKHFLEVNGWDLPTTLEQVKNLARALSTPPLEGPIHGNHSGALEWLDATGKSQLSDDLYEGNISGFDLSRPATVLDYLLEHAPLKPNALENPRRAIDDLIQSPKGKALGEAIQANFDMKSIKGSATDWLLAALSLDNALNTTQAEARGSVSGFTLMGANSWGKPASTTVNDLAQHLIGTGRASSPEKASILTHLLLSVRAPEFLVKDTPDTVTPGSHSWVSFVTAVARIEAQAPGSTSAMTYGQVMLEANIAPVSAQERQTEFAAQQEALKDWGVANGLPFASTEIQMNDVRNAFSKQIGELQAASNAQRTPLLSRKELALEQLKAALPDMDPQLFKTKCISLKYHNQDFPGPYSVLDLYLDERAIGSVPGVTRQLAGFPLLDELDTRPTTNEWVSSSSDVNIGEVIGKIKNLPRTSETFKAAYSSYCEGIEKSIATQVKHLIAKLPLEDRKNLEYGKITVGDESLVGVFQTGFTADVKEGEIPTLVVEAVRDGHAFLYEINLNDGLIRKRQHYEGSLPSQTEALQAGAGWVSINTVTPEGNYTPGLTDEKEGMNSTPNNFDSEKTSYIANAVVKFAHVRRHENELKGLTTFDTEEPFYKRFNEFMLNLIPLRSAIVNFQDGNIGAGLFDLSLDVFGFAIGLGAAAKGAKAVQAGISVFTRLARGAKIVGRAAIGGLNPLSGLDDVARAGWAGLKSAGRSINGLRGAVSPSLDFTGLAKRADVAEVSIKSAGGGHTVRTLAKVDKKTGDVYRYSAKADQVYGRPLAGYSLNPGGANDRNSLLGVKLATDNVVDVGGPMRELKALDREIFTFVDDVQSTTRLNVIAHGYERLPHKKLFNIGTTIADSADNSYSPQKFLELLKKHNIDPQKYDSVRFVTCFSGEAGTHSFGANFGKLTGKPVAAFEGPVTVKLNDLEQPFRDNLKITKIQNPGLDDSSVHALAEQKLKQDFEGKIDRVVKLDTEHRRADIYDVGGVGKTRHKKVIINYRPSFFGTKPWNTAG